MLIPSSVRSTAYRHPTSPFGGSSKEPSERTIPAVGACKEGRSTMSLDSLHPVSSAVTNVLKIAAAQVAYVQVSKLHPESITTPEVRSENMEAGYRQGRNLRVPPISLS